MALAGWTVQWKSPPRDDAETTWARGAAPSRRADARDRVGRAASTWLESAFLWWLLPVVGALIAVDPAVGATPAARSLGPVARAARALFLIPEESRPPPEIEAMQRYQREARAAPGLADAVVDPTLNALVAAHAVARHRLTDTEKSRRQALGQRLLRDGADALSAQERGALIGDPVAMSDLHYRVWTSPGLHETWRAALERARLRACDGPGIDRGVSASR